MKLVSSLALAGAAWFCVTNARAVIVYNGDTVPANTTAPSDDPGWSYVGSSNSSVGSIVYLGDYAGGYWAISAAHVIGASSTSVTLNGVSYGIIAGSAIGITDALGNPVDLTVFRLDANPGLSNLALASGAMTAGTTINYVGYGLSRATSRSYWNVTANSKILPTDPDYIWTPKPSAVGSNKQGYAVTGGYTKSWGANTVTGIGQTVNIGQGDTQAFYSTFNASNGSSMLFTGDSGGATFAKRNGVWELVGINDAIGTLTDQPGGTVVNGDVSYSTDIFTYKSRILAAVPEPSAYGLLGGAALAGLALVRRRRRATK